MQILETRESTEFIFVRPKAREVFEKKQLASWDTVMNARLDERIIENWDNLIDDYVFGGDYYMTLDALNEILDGNKKNANVSELKDLTFDFKENTKKTKESLHSEIIGHIGSEEESRSPFREIDIVYEEVLEGNDTRIRNILESIYSGIQLHSFKDAQLRNLDILRALIILLKHNYENKTLEFEIYDEMDNKINEILMEIKISQDTSNLEFKFNELMDIVNEIIKGNKILHDEANDMVFKSTDSLKGEYKEYQLKKK